MIENFPDPQIQDGGVLVQNVVSLISAGTERTSVETAQASMMGKARKRPDLVQQVKDNIQKEGLIATYKKVKNRLDNYKELGYSSAGIVLESSVSEFKPGDRVACAGVAYHAEKIFVKKNLVAEIPENVSFEETAFTTIGSIAIQGIRQANPRLGDSIAVIGLGLIGLITVQLAKTNGCRVIGFDINDSNFQLAKSFSCDECYLTNEDAVGKVNSFSRGIGVDSTIITASTQSNDPMELALDITRKRGRIVVVGTVGMNIPRSPFYEKELTVTIACSYGPGRYDRDYEEKGIDYPVWYVRWTENRNMQAFLDLLSQGKINVRDLITHTFPITDAIKAYDVVTGKVKEKHIGILLSYPDAVVDEKPVIPVKDRPSDKVKTDDKIGLGFVGAGNFATSYRLPFLEKLKNTNLVGVCDTSGVNAKSVAKKFGFEHCTSHAEEIFDNTNVNTVFIASQHDSHAEYILKALESGKHVFVEKPLCINENQLEEIKLKVSKSAGNILHVGFNRRFSKTFVDIKNFFSEVNEPLLINYRVNAGFIPKNHWIQDPDQGGRIVGEVCHFIDCMVFLTGARPVRVYAESVDSENAQVTENDNVHINIKFSDGSVGSIIYLANGDSAVSKEYCEVFGGGRAAIMDNFRKTSFFRNNRKRVKKYNGSKGHKEEIQSFIRSIQDSNIITIPIEEMILTTVTTFKVLESLTSAQPMNISI